MTPSPELSCHRFRDSSQITSPNRPCDLLQQHERSRHHRLSWGIEMVGNSLIRFPDAITRFKLSHRTLFGNIGRLPRLQVAGGVGVDHVPDAM